MSLFRSKATFSSQGRVAGGALGVPAGGAAGGGFGKGRLDEVLDSLIFPQTMGMWLPSQAVRTACLATVKGHEPLRGYGTPTVTRLTVSFGPSEAASLACVAFLTAVTILA